MLGIDMEFKKGIFIVRLKGKLNETTYKTLEKELNDIIIKNGIKYLLLNLEDLDYIDEYGIGIIWNNYLNILKNKGKMLLCGFNQILDYKINYDNVLYQIKDEEGAYQLIQI